MTGTRVRRQLRPGVSILLASLTAGILAGCGAAAGGSSPDERLIEAFDALEEGDCDKFASYLTDEFREKASDGCLEAKGVVKSVDLKILDTRIDGDHAEIKARIVYSTILGDDEDENPFAMRRIDGDWYIDDHGGLSDGEESEGSGTVANLPDGFASTAAWYDPRKLLGATAKTIVVTDESGIVGLDAKSGKESWSLTTEAPDDLPGAEFKDAHFLGRSVALVWAGTNDTDSLEETDEVTRITFVETDSGEEISSETVADSEGSSGQLGFNGVVVSRNDSGAGNRVAFSESGTPNDVDLDYATGLLAVHDGGIITARSSGHENTLDAVDPKVPGKFESNNPVIVTGDRAIRVLQEEATNDEGYTIYNAYYQVVDPAAMTPVSDPKPCDSSRTGSRMEVLSPNREYAAIDQAVIEMATGKVRCLDDLSESLSIEVSRIADDGSLYGAAGDRSFWLATDPDAAPEELDEGATLPLVMLPGAALFATDDGGIAAYARK